MLTQNSFLSKVTDDFLYQIWKDEATTFSDTYTKIILQNSLNWCGTSIIDWIKNQIW